jgi:hypothetical protein
MRDYEDYDVDISDLEAETPVEITKDYLIKVFNEKIKESYSLAFSSVGIEIDVKSEWENRLREDGTILWEYTKLGWKAMHYQKTDQSGKVVRNWLSFKSLDYKGKKK